MGRWEELDKKRAVQSGTGPGEFGSPTQEIEGNPDNPYQDQYSQRKRYQLGHGNESPSPKLKEYLVNTHRNPRESTHEAHVIEPYDINRKIKREGTPPLSREEMEWRHKELRKLHDKPTGRINHWWRDRKGHYE